MVYVRIRAEPGWASVAAGLFLFYAGIFYVNNEYLYWLYNYMGAATQELTASRVIVWLIFALMGAFFCKAKLNRPGDLVLAIIYIVIVPSAIVLQGANSYSPQIINQGEIDGLVVCVAFGIFLVSCFNALSFRREEQIAYKFNVGFMRLLVAANIIALGLMVFYSASYFSLDFSGQYTRRILAREAIPTETFVAYYCSVMIQGLYPIFLGYGLQFRRSGFIIIGILNVLVLWGSSGQKYPFVVLLLIIFFFFWYRRFGFVRFNVLIYSALALLVAGMIESYFTGYSYINDYFLRRVYTVSSTLLGASELFISTHGFNFYSDTLIGMLLDGSRNQPLSFQVGAAIFKNPETNANVDFLAVAWMQGGFLAVLVEACLVGGIIVALNKAYENHNNALVVSVGILVATKIIEQSLLVALVSSGILMMILVAYFLMRPVKSSRAIELNNEADLTKHVIK